MGVRFDEVIGQKRKRAWDVFLDREDKLTIPVSQPPQPLACPSGAPPISARNDCEYGGRRIAGVLTAYVVLKITEHSCKFGSYCLHNLHQHSLGRRGLP
jgi:hypothetical protein